LADVAADIFKQGQIEPFTRSEPASIAGRSGQAFFAKKSYGGSVNFMVVLVKIDATHIASSGRVARDGLTAARLAPVNELMRKVRIIGAK